MEGLLPIVFNKDLKVNSVDARELYKVLGVKTDFSLWLKRRIDDTMAEENVDFTPPLKSGGDNKGKLSNKLAIVLSIHLAKEFAMLERNDIGKEVRKYFIRCEETLIELLKKERVKQEAPVPRAKDDSLAYLNKKLNSAYTRAYWIKHKRAPLKEEYKRLATFINSLALGTKEIEQRQVMTDTGAIRVTNLLIMLIRGFETGSIDTQETRSTFISLYGQSTVNLTLIDRELIKSIVA
jgi:hypothetical protein